jgi:hypothetical protein
MQPVDAHFRPMWPPSHLRLRYVGYQTKENLKDNEVKGTGDADEVVRA